MTTRLMHGLLAATLVVLALAVADVRPASAVTNAPGTFLACGYGAQASAPGDPTCTTLDNAITEALAFDGDATIQLWPGIYCPVTIPSTTHHLTIVGSAPASGSADGEANGGPESMFLSMGNSSCSSPSTRRSKSTRG